MMQSLMYSYMVCLSGLKGCRVYWEAESSFLVREWPTDLGTPGLVEQQQLLKVAEYQKEE